MDNYSTIVNYNNGQFSIEDENSSNIEKYIKSYLDILSSWMYDLPRGSFSFRIVFHLAHDLYDGDYGYGQDYYLYKNIEVPTIHFSLYDVFNHELKGDVHAKRFCKIIDSSIWNYYVPWDMPVIDEKGNIIDWKYNENYDLFVKALKNISQNTKNSLYNLDISHEYADLNARLMAQSHLKGTHDQISPFLFHSENEMRMKIRDFEDNHRVTLPTIRQYRWHFLLLDDKGIEPLSGTNKSEIFKLQIITHNLYHILGFDENKIWFRFFDFSAVRGDDKKIINEETQEIIKEKEVNGENKLVPQPKISYGRVKNGEYKVFVPEYVAEDNGKCQKLFCPNSEEPHTPDDVQIVIDCVKHVDAAQYCLQKYKYEIVLLDYLLDHDREHDWQEFGYNLLEQLRNWHKETYLKNKEGKEKKREKDLSIPIYTPGPNGRWFFMFISAFTTAVHERMLEKGFERTERGFWFLGDGACPTNTPYLFSYQLMLLMRHRISDLRKESEGGCLTLVELLEKIFLISETSNSNDNLTIRESAHNHFNHVLFMGEKYHRLENDLTKEEEGKISTGRDIIEMRGSMLVQSAFQYVHLFSGAFFEHLQHLVYLIAFGTIRQWTELWEEYIFIRKTLTQYDELTNGDIGTRINEAIRNYIIRLKDNSN